MIKIRLTKWKQSSGKIKYGIYWTRQSRSARKIFWLFRLDKLSLDVSP